MNSRRGQTLAEMSLVAPFLVFFLCVVIEFGWSFYAMAMLNNSSRIGARVGSSGLKNNSAIADAIVLARGRVRVASAAITITTSAGAVVDNATITFNAGGGYSLSKPVSERAVGDYLQVEVMSPYQTFTGLVDLQKLAGINDYRDRSTFLIKY